MSVFVVTRETPPGIRLDVYGNFEAMKATLPEGSTWEGSATMFYHSVYPIYNAAGHYIGINVWHKPVID